MRVIVVLYDSWCPFCKRSIKKFRKFDCLNRVEFLSFREEKYVDEYNLDIEQLKKRMHSIILENNKVEVGIDAINRICKNSPLLWPLVPILTISSYCGIGHKIYDWISSKRLIFPTGCNGDACKL
ncbi:thiol-disulfide oxidoreductase DCC family protein [Cytobacillus kochii]|uniref:DUF393 domain-containing protein n=1 Tax=Cytobacillus kochii TaxID=859143 RepID=A0A248TGZ0_9BACI|nr:DUF393 domain-containing protein [Cytobacillus kochii]ASV67468.1 hypothetical protein CKF48_09080 [Cytobacillus kochii]